MKICPKCNTQVSDDIKFCNNCGNPLADVAPVQTGNTDNSGSQQPSGSPFPFNANPGQETPQNNAAPVGANQQPQPGVNPLFSAPPIEEPKKKSPFPFILIGVGVCFIVVIAVVLVLVLGGGYKQPVNKLVSLVNSKSTDVNAYLTCISPSFIPETYKEALGLIKGGDAKKELDDAIKEAFEEAYDGIEDEFGKGWKISVEWKKNKKLSDKDLKKLQDNYDSLAKMLEKADLDDEDTWEDIADMLDDEYDTELNTGKAAKMGENLLKKLDKFEITEGYEVKVKVTVKGKDDDDSATMEANIIKANGKWFIDPLSFSEGGMSLSNYTYLLNNL